MSRVRAVVGGFLALPALFACNAILGNEQGHYLVAGDGGSPGSSGGASGAGGGSAGARPDSGAGGSGGGAGGRADSGSGGTGVGGQDAGPDAPGGGGSAGAGGITGAGGAVTTGPPSCRGLAVNCGPNGDESCCTSILVPGGTYNRSNSIGFAATVSDFKLDKYEITVGRFRKFLPNYRKEMTPLGAGKNPNDPSDPGWDTAWNPTLPASPGELAAAVECNITFQMWTDTAGVHETRPMNCISWYDAQAFCIWDGGRLPTEAEWNYAAAGGSLQRLYPWGDTPVPGPNADLVVWGCYYMGSGPGTCTEASIAKVGSLAAGNGFWGHADLSGNLWEWNVDWYHDPYPQVPCTDCANFTEEIGRVVRSGEFGDYVGVEQSLYTSHRDFFGPAVRESYIGARCARLP